MNDLQVFDFGGNKVRTVIVDGKPWFVGNDVAEILGYSSSKNAVSTHCKHMKLLKGIDSEPLTSSPRGIGIIPESDVYRLIFSSKMPTAEKFQDWVMGTVLPAIRKNGTFTADHIINQGALSAELMFTERSCDILRANEASRLLMLSKVAKRNGIDPVGLLPDYTSEPLTISLTELLKRNGVKMSAIKANKILVGKGILEVLERPGKSGVKKFKSFTEAGLQYGKNLINPQNQRETQPHFFEDVDISELLK